MTDKQEKGKSLKENQWKAGESGNPNGRPKGSKNKVTLIREALEENAMEAISKDVVLVLQKAVELALDGDGAMIKLVADKFIPNAKLEGNKKGTGGFGGINITIAGMDAKPVINAEVITNDDEEDDNER